METKLTYYGHSAFMLSHNDVSMIFDPFLSQNPWKKAMPEDIACQYIFVSHNHDDHYGDTTSIALKNDALVITTAEIAHRVEEEGGRAHPMHIGGKFNFPFGTVRLVPAFHGSGIAGGHAAGCVVKFFDKTIYYAGDTGVFSDMKLLDRFGKINYALLPIGDNYTMGIEDAALAASWIGADVTIPIHYKTWPIIDKEPKIFTSLVETKFHQAAIVLDPGETIIL